MIAKAVILQTFYGQHWQLTAVRITPYFFGVGAGKVSSCRESCPNLQLSKMQYRVSPERVISMLILETRTYATLPLPPPQLCQSNGVLLSCKKVRSYYDLVNDSICVNALTLFEEMGKI